MGALGGLGLACPSAGHLSHPAAWGSWLPPPIPVNTQGGGLESCCSHTPGQVPSLSPLPPPIVPGFPRPGGIHLSPPMPLVKEQTAGGGLLGRAPFLEKSGERTREGRERGRWVGTIQGLCTPRVGSGPRRPPQKKAGHVLIPAAPSQSPQPPTSSPCPPHVAKSPPPPALTRRGCKGLSRACGVRWTW